MTLAKGGERKLTSAVPASLAATGRNNDLAALSRRFAAANRAIVLAQAVSTGVPGGAPSRRAVDLNEIGGVG